MSESGICVNGKWKALPEPGQTVADLLEAEGLGREGVAVEVNRRVVFGREFDHVRLAQGDRVEIVRFVGGG